LLTPSNRDPIAPPRRERVEWRSVRSRVGHDVALLVHLANVNQHVDARER
jgi:hypothetical protein